VTATTLIAPTALDVAEYSTKELAALLGVPHEQLATSVVGRSHWGTLLPPATSAERPRRWRPIDTVVIACLTDLRDTVGALPMELRRELVDALYLTEWGTPVVIVQDERRLVVGYAPDWSIVDRLEAAR
jgi:hypothetical protein